jgi:hypothetical protein
MCRIPVQDIQFNTTTTTPQPTTPQSKKSHVGVVARPVISTIVALLLLGAVILGFIWYRRRYNSTAGGSSAFPSGVIAAASGVEVTPFVSSRPEMTHRDPMTRTGWQQPQHWLPGTVARGAGAHDQYSSPFVIHSQSSTSVPIGMSDKELARMRAENLPSRQAIDATAVTLADDASGSQSPVVTGQDHRTKRNANVSTLVPDISITSRSHMG